MSIISHKELLSLLRYEPETGLFYWLITKNGTKAGKVAGGSSGHGYIIIGLNGGRYYAHILAWFYIKAEWPENDIDHEDGNGENNRFSNLRPSTRGQNLRNKSYEEGSYPGVRFLERLGKWEARIYIDRKPIYLGVFYEKKDALTARKKAEKKYYEGFLPRKA